MRNMNNSSISTASSIHAKLTDAAAKEFFWGCELTKEKPTILWNFEEEEDDQDFLQHTLFLRHAILGKGAQKDEQNIVEIETKNFAGDDLKQPLVIMTEGKTEMCSLDLNFSHEIPVTFRLVEGSGPIFLSAAHLVEFPPEIEEDEFLTATETETDTEELKHLEEEEEEERDAPSIKGKKRKSNGATGGKRKVQRGKTDSDVAADDEDDEDEDDEEEEEEEEEEDDEEEKMETTDEDDDDEDEEEEEEEEEEETPKRSRKSKAKKPVPVVKKAKVTAKSQKGGKKKTK